MPTKSNATKNCALKINCTASDDLQAVTPLSDYRLKVQFMDGSTGMVLMENLILSQNAGVFAALRDVSLFNQAHIEYGVVTWPGEIDLAPDVMYEEIKAHGVWLVL